MTSKEALKTIKEYLLEKLKEDGSELGFLIIKENVDVLEELVERVLEIITNHMEVLSKNELDTYKKGE